MRVVDSYYVFTGGLWNKASEGYKKPYRDPPMWCQILVNNGVMIYVVQSVWNESGGMEK